MMSDANPGPRHHGEQQSEPKRLRAAARREALIAATLAILTEEGVDAVSMDAVAARAGVSRPLVYKHFANRTELLGDVLREEAAKLDAAIGAAVADASGFEESVRALIRAVIDAVNTHSSVVSALLRAAGRNTELQHEQRRRDRRTVRHFANLAMSEFDIDEAQAKAAVSILLTGVDSVRTQARRGLTPDDRTFLEDVYVELAVGGLEAIAQRRTSTGN